MKCKLASTILLLFFLKASSGKAMSDTLERAPFYIKTNALEYIDIYTGSLYNVSAEIKLGKWFAINSEVGKYFSLPSKLRLFMNHKGFIVREELKVYRNDRVSTMHNYCSLEFSYSEQEFNRTDSMDYDLDSISYSYDKYYHATRKFIGLQFLFGGIQHFKHNLFLEVYGGLGLRFNTIKCDLPDHEAHGRYFGDWPVPSNYSMNEGYHVNLKFNFGVKLGFSIGNRKRV
ncbi:MAG: hypothetical protein ACKVOK_16505 [Flavobacteriales bacterium]